MGFVINPLSPTLGGYCKIRNNKKSDTHRNNKKDKNNTTQQLQTNNKQQHQRVLTNIIKTIV